MLERPGIARAARNYDIARYIHAIDEGISKTTMTRNIDHRYAAAGARLSVASGVPATLGPNILGEQINIRCGAYLSLMKNLPADAIRNDTKHIILRVFELQEPALAGAMAGSGAIGASHAGSCWRRIDAGRSGSAAIVLQSVAARVEGA